MSRLGSTAVSGAAYVEPPGRGCLDECDQADARAAMIIQQPSCGPCWQYIEASANDLAEVTAFADVHAGETMEDAS